MNLLTKCCKAPITKLFGTEYPLGGRTYGQSWSVPACECCKDEHPETFAACDCCGEKPYEVDTLYGDYRGECAKDLRKENAG